MDVRLVTWGARAARVSKHQQPTHASKVFKETWWKPIFRQITNLKLFNWETLCDITDFVWNIKRADYEVIIFNQQNVGQKDLVLTVDSPAPPTALTADVTQPLVFVYFASLEKLEISVIKVWVYPVNMGRVCSVINVWLVVPWKNREGGIWWRYS